MGKLCLILFGFVTSFMVLVESQRQSCSTKNDCRENGCCYNNLCFYNSACSLYESLCKTRPGRIGCSCYRNSDCTSGCCFDSTCTVYDSKCGAKNCYYNFQCSSGCCKSYRCEWFSEACSNNYRTTTISYNTTTMVATKNSADDYVVYYDSDKEGGGHVDYDGYNTDHRDTSRSKWILVFAPAAAIKLIFWVVFCWYRGCCRGTDVSRTARVRRTAQVRRDDVVPIVQHDRLQYRYELLTGTEDIPETQPPACSTHPEPKQCENAKQNSGQKPAQILLTLSAATEGTHGVPL